MFQNIILNKQQLKNLLITLIIVSSCPKLYAKNLWKFLPQPKQSYLFSEYVYVNSQSKLNIPFEFKKHYKSVFYEFQNVLKTINNGGKSVSINARIVALAYKNLPVFNNYEGYMIKIDAKNVEISSPSLRGLLYGLTYLEGIAFKNNGKIQKGTIENWPDLKIRALHIGEFFSKKELKDWIKKMRFSHFNTLVIRLGKPRTNIIALKRFKLFPEKLTINWFLKIKECINIQDFQEIVKYAKENGLDLVPEIKFLTHQEKFIADTYPEFMFNKLTYDPQNEKLYTNVIFPLLNDIIEIVHPKAIHIGHDEVAGRERAFFRKNLNPWEVMLPADLFLKDVIKLHDYLKRQGIKTWMWGDMLLSQKEFPTMLKRHLHGVKEYNKLRKLLPKDIVICDWHYFDEKKDFPSSFAFIKEGYRVIGVTWFKENTIKNFTKYIANLPYNNLGMMATTWKGALRKKIKQKGIKDNQKIKLIANQIIDEIIKKSGNIFWNTSNN